MKKNMINKKIIPSVIGLGYVGLPIFLRLNKKFKTIGFDIDKSRIEQLSKRRDTNKEFKKNKLALNNKSLFSSEIKDLKKSNFYIVTVPTPIFKNNTPDLRNLVNVSNILKKIVKKDDIIFFESTVYPGVTEKICVPIIENKSNLKNNKDFFVGYSPERINPGDKNHSIEKINKIVAIKKDKLDKAKLVYKYLAKKLILTDKIQEAEASKVIENIQRDLNIGLMNEIYQVCLKSNINFNNVIELAGSKWNFIKYNPGLVGGHCLPVDPYYFSWFAKKLKLNTKIILAGRKTNNDMVKFSKKIIIQKIKQHGLNPKKIRVLILGLTYKKNVADLRNSLSIKLFESFKSCFRKLSSYDPIIDKKFSKKYSLINRNEIKNFDAYIILTKHDSFKTIFKLMNKKILIDIFS
jgi:UDP-N-acetyl-D-galactosamine dehydrogenase